MINFSTLFNTPQTINLRTALPEITRSITLVGPGANLLTVQRALAAGTPLFRIFEILGASNGVAISGMTLANGNAGNGASFGGGILSQSPLTLSQVHLNGNRGQRRGGLLGICEWRFYRLHV